MENYFNFALLKANGGGDEAVHLENLFLISTSKDDQRVRDLVNYLRYNAASELSEGDSARANDLAELSRLIRSNRIMAVKFNLNSNKKQATETYQNFYEHSRCDSLLKQSAQSVCSLKQPNKNTRHLFERTRKQILKDSIPIDLQQVRG